MGQDPRNHRGFLTIRDAKLSPVSRIHASTKLPCISGTWYTFSITATISDECEVRHEPETQPTKCLILQPRQKERRQLRRLPVVLPWLHLHDWYRMVGSRDELLQAFGRLRFTVKYHDLRTVGSKNEPILRLCCEM